jgi:L-alanine-DL-glutamate epimerase-like enolase superfamily enzyme
MAPYEKCRAQITLRVDILRRTNVKITEVEALLLRQPGLRPDIADGSQDALIVKVHTDEGLAGVGETDSSPFVAKSIIDAPPSHKISSGLRAVLIGQDPLDTDRIWDLMFQSSLYYVRRGAAIHAMSGIDIALWDIACAAACGNSRSRRATST